MMRKVFAADVNKLNDVLAFTEEALDSVDCPMKYSMILLVSIEEIFVNVAHYAYQDGGDVILEIEYEELNRKLTFRFIDQGVEFNPLMKADPDITLSAEEREIGGLGIYMMKQTMDEVEYVYKNNENILTMIKWL